MIRDRETSRNAVQARVIATTLSEEDNSSAKNAMFALVVNNYEGVFDVYRRAEKNGGISKALEQVIERKQADIANLKVEWDHEMEVTCENEMRRHGILQKEIDYRKRNANLAAKYVVRSVVEKDVFGYYGINEHSDNLDLVGGKVKAIKLLTLVQEGLLFNSNADLQNFRLIKNRLVYYGGYNESTAGEIAHKLQRAINAAWKLNEDRDANLLCLDSNVTASTK